MNVDMKAVRTAERRLMAIYYAYGRKDAERSTIDANEFGDHYAALWAEVEAGTSGFCPSVQDAYDTWVKAGTFIPVAIADEVRDFLAKVVDEAQP